jgi:hypothetical protein
MMAGQDRAAALHVRRGSVINYRSRLGDEIENWAIFEPPPAPTAERGATAHEPAPRPLVQALIIKSA